MLTSPLDLICFLQVSGIGYNNVGEVTMDGDVVHGFSNISFTKIVEVRITNNIMGCSHVKGLELL